jgi:hypothetical protein
MPFPVNQAAIPFRNSKFAQKQDADNADQLIAADFPAQNPRLIREICVIRVQMAGSGCDSAG